MKFSVAIPAFKPRFFREAVESVLAQSYADWELVIVDDASPDDLRAIAEPFLADDRVRFYRNDANFGAVNVVDNWNRCLEYCTGDYIICMGDDDRLLPNCLEHICAAIELSPDYGLYHTRTQIISESGSVVETLRERPERESSLEMICERWRGRSQFIGDFCFKLDLLRKNGGFFKLPLAWGSDDVSAYIAAKGDGSIIKDGVINVNAIGFQYRTNGATISSDNSYRIKLNALLESAEWFERELALRSNSADGAACPSDILKVFSERFRSYAKFYVRKDIVNDKTAIKYWLSRRKQIGLTVWDISLGSLKALITKR